MCTCVHVYLARTLNRPDARARPSLVYDIASSSKRDAELVILLRLVYGVRKAEAHRNVGLREWVEDDAVDVVPCVAQLTRRRFLMEEGKKERVR